MGKKLEKAWLPLGILIGYVILAIFLRPIFYLNDDVTMRSIMSGAYTGTPDGHAVYMEYPLTGVLAFLYKILPALPWFDLFLAGSLLFCLIEIVISCKANSILEKCFFLVGGGALLWDTMWYMHYTIVAAVLAGTGIYLWQMRERKTSAVICLILSYMVRKQVFFLSLPFLVVGVLFKGLHALGDRTEKMDKTYMRKQLKREILSAGILFGVVTLCMILHGIMYGSDEWRSYEKYNKVRTDLYDYTCFASLDQDDPLITGLEIDGLSGKVLSSYDTMLAQGIDCELLQKVTDAMPDNRSGFRGALTSYLNHLKYDRYPLRFMVIIGYMIVIFAVIRRKRPLLLLPVGCLLGGRSLIWIYLMAEGRFPERVVISLLMIEMLLLAGMLATVCSDHGVKNAASLVGLIVVISFLVWNINYTAQRVNVQNSFQTQWDTLKEYCNAKEDSLYLLDVYPVVAYADRLYAADSSNTMLLGGWLTKSPLAEQCFEKIGNGSKDGIDALYNSDKVYFVTDENADITWTLQLILLRYPEAKLCKVDSLSCGQDKQFAFYAVEK